MYMENSRQNTRFHWRNAKRLERLSEVMDTTPDGKVEFGNDVEIDGTIKVNGTESFVDSKNKHFIKDLEDAVNGENTVEITFTEDDWDEDEQAYIKHTSINNSYIKINFPEEDGIYKIYSPYFKGFVPSTFPEGLVDGFAGLESRPEIRNIQFAMSTGGYEFICVFNGLVQYVAQEL